MRGWLRRSVVQTKCHETYLRFFAILNTCGIAETLVVIVLHNTYMPARFLGKIQKAQRKTGYAFEIKPQQSKFL